MTELLKAKFKFRNETPGAIRFEEETPKGQAPMSGGFYLKKYAAEQLGSYGTIYVYVSDKPIGGADNGE